MTRYFYAALAAVSALGLVAPASAAIVFEAANNGSFATAQNIGGGFSLDADANITSSTTIPHVTVRGGANYENEYDYYKFSVDAPGSTGIFDIDFGAYDNFTASFDSYLRLFDSNGNSLAAIDDAIDPSAGSVQPGAYTLDAYLNYTFQNAGIYTIRVGACCESGFNGSYDLQVSLQNAAVNSAVPEPATWAMMLVGFGFIGGAMRSTKRRQKQTLTYA